MEDALPDRLRGGPFRAILEYTQPIKRGEQVSVRTGTNTLHIDAGDEARASARWFALTRRTAIRGEVFRIPRRQSRIASPDHEPAPCRTRCRQP
ncbi:hypothetical protein ACETU7_20245 [Rhodococcus sp. 3Y1]